MTTEDMYKDYILDLYKNPINFGSLEKFTHEKIKNNSLCGDTLKIRLDVDKGIIRDVKYTGQGCAISIASASIVSEEIIGKKVSEVIKMKKEDVLDLLEIPLSPGRLKCALFFLVAVQEALTEK